MTVRNIEQNILRLPPLKRIKIVERILKSLDKPDEQIERAWAAESDKRLKAYKNGLVKGVDWKIIKKSFSK